MTPLRQIKQPSPRKRLHQSSKQRCRCRFKRKLVLMQLTLTKTSLPNAATAGKVARTVETSPSPFSANEGVRPATSSVIMEMMFHLGHQDQQRLKKWRTLSRSSQLPKNKCRKTTPRRLNKRITLTRKSKLPKNKSRKSTPTRLKKRITLTR